ncbi:hypothetical protein SS1G_12978 [Sclerotinia sclerotiorum 1980 UF-70]|uniref:Uncharacterized protein n=1 Tax=Sclerotinia sclerotiorum (strain ATCC 18683 / 1980 / Ss-1) TaxID=665079 RepID=A7F5V0_SCLS1|nr:hypothetical protein SS1G_12978 [Sclerotinia sclerotiorum 1980 UF-70]EDN98121.1 hypothetical protein SS1G_12978 [Sclerotinia sclerotiorum 1980 UF-70]
MSTVLNFLERAHQIYNTWTLKRRNLLVGRRTGLQGEAPFPTAKGILAESWLLNSRNPILPRIIEKVRPLVLPKLREEQERSKSKGKKKSVKDVVTDAIVREESEESISLQDIPEAADDSDLFISEDEGPHGAKRSRDARESTDSNFSPLSKRRKDGGTSGDEDDKKKMAMDTSYDGFSVNGRVLCLVVKRKDKKGKASPANGGQAMLEDWITSTQIPPQLEDV